MTAIFLRWHFAPPLLGSPDLLATTAPDPLAQQARAGAEGFANAWLERVSASEEGTSPFRDDDF